MQGHLIVAAALVASAIVVTLKFVEVKGEQDIHPLVLPRATVDWRENARLRWAMERGDAKSAYDVVDDAADGDDAASISL